MKTIDHRKNPRRECRIPVDGRQGGAFENICAVDISRGGLGFVSSRPVPLRKKIAVEVELSFGGDPVLMLGQVQWVKPLKEHSSYRVGLKFIKVLSSGSRSRLIEYFEE